jgi:hypothetical protein
MVLRYSCRRSCRAIRRRQPGSRKGWAAQKDARRSVCTPPFLPFSDRVSYDLNLTLCPGNFPAGHPSSRTPLLASSLPPPRHHLDRLRPPRHSLSRKLPYPVLSLSRSRRPYCPLVSHPPAFRRDRQLRRRIRDARAGSADEDERSEGSVHGRAVEGDGRRVLGESGRNEGR